MPTGRGREAAEELARTIASFPQTCLRNDCLSAYEQAGLPLDEAIANELSHGLKVLGDPQMVAGATRFAKGAGRHGRFED